MYNGASWYKRVSLHSWFVSDASQNHQNVAQGYPLMIDLDVCLK